MLPYDAEVSRLEQAVGRLDPVLKPSSLFDPSAPATTGRIVALTTIAQRRHPLVSLQPFYGVGVYALYYRSPFDAYSLLSGTEQPIYVGKADPKDVAAKDAVSQGTSLFDRLNEHRKNIAKATSTLSEEDFDCRFLIVQTGYQRAADLAVDGATPRGGYRSRPSLLTGSSRLVSGPSREDCLRWWGPGCWAR